MSYRRKVTMLLFVVWYSAYTVYGSPISSLDNQEKFGCDDDCMATSKDGPEMKDHRINEVDLAKSNGSNILEPTVLRRKKRQDDKADTINAAVTVPVDDIDVSLQPQTQDASIEYKTAQDNLLSASDLVKHSEFIGTKFDDRNNGNSSEELQEDQSITFDSSDGTADIKLNSAKINETTENATDKESVSENEVNKESVSENEVKGYTLLSDDTSYTINTVNESGIHVSTTKESLTTNQVDPEPKPLDTLKTAGAINTLNVSSADDSSKSTTGFSEPFVESKPVAESNHVLENNPAVYNSAVVESTSAVERDLDLENDFVDRHVGDDFDDSDEYMIDDDLIGEACRDDFEIINDILNSLRTDQSEYFTEYGNMVEDQQHLDDHVDCDSPHAYDTPTHYELSVDSDSEKDLDELFNSDHDFKHDSCDYKDEVEDEDDFDFLEENFF